MIMDRASLFLFVKYPQEGKVKTRLGKQIGYDRAARFYREIAQTCVQRFSRIPGVDFTVYFDPPEEEERLRAWLGENFRYLAQPPGDLGERLQRGFAYWLPQRRRVIAIGSDSPDLPLEYIEQACDILLTKDAVIGPTEDGGYYLIGLSRFLPELFEGVPWSTNEVLNVTRRKAVEIGASFELLPKWYDVDTLEDLERWNVSNDKDWLSMLERIGE
ncbi:MAG: TIGR04282 family arsenosugar biosynthesis glycosyltransferase [Candidatus Omnitrophota bacterium]